MAVMRLKSPTVRLFFQQVGLAYNKENIKASHYRPFVRGILQIADVSRLIYLTLEPIAMN